MKTLKKIFVLIVCCLFIGSLGTIAFAQVKNVENSKTKLKIAHGQAKDSLIGKSLNDVADNLSNNSNFDVEVYTSGVLGSEKDMIELVKAGVLDMAKVSATALGQFDDYYSIFALPYLFTGTEHYYNAMDNSEAIQEIFTRDKDKGYMAIGWYASGARNVYKKEEGPVKGPEDMKGKKFRVQESSTSMKMIELMGGAPVPMSASETYTAMQQNVIDGAENTEMALTVDKHGELAKSYTYTEHQYSPDIVIISSKYWDSLNEEQQSAIKEALKESNEQYKKDYVETIEDATKEAEGMGVTFYKIDKTPFIEAVQPMHQDFKDKGEKYKEYYEDIQQYK
ncbi:MAG TPA: C4-dicarboxylate ABC transporter [Clostridium sp.]|nr:C4-dicarboxylate ABC transporter [Clostridium sp.]